MDKCFIVDKDSQFVIDMKRYENDKEEQRKYVVEFFDNHEIEARFYLVGGNGFVNQPFQKDKIKDIRLSIEATEADLVKFGNQLKVPNKRNDLRGFKTNSEILKLFAKGCIENNIIINLHKPSLRDVFKTLGYSRFSSCYFEHKDIHYLMISSEFLTDDDVPEGFKQIKTSEYYKVVEEIETIQKNTN